MRKLSPSRKFLIVIEAALAIIVISIIATEYLVDGWWAVPFGVAGIASGLFVTLVFVVGVTGIYDELEGDREDLDRDQELRRLRSMVNQVRELVFPSADMAEDEDLYGLVVDIRRIVYEPDPALDSDREG